MGSSPTPCADCCAAINKLYPRLYQLVRIMSDDSVDKVLFLSELIEMAKRSTNAIYQKLKCQRVICCQELIEGLYEVFKVYVNQVNRDLAELVVFLNLILVPAGFPAVTAP